MIKLITISLITFFTGINLVLAQAVGTQSASSYEDELSTLQLDTKLNSSGRIGGVTTDLLGFIYVSNFANKVWRISESGEVKLLSDGLYGASGNTIDQYGNLYQANFFGNSITIISRFGEISQITNNLLNGPVGMMFDKDQNLYVCNCSDNKIIKFTPTNDASVFAEGELFNCPNGITMDADGQIFIVNFGNDHVLKLGDDGSANIFATIGNAQGNAHIAYARNHLFVTKIKSNSLFKIDSEGNATLLVSSFPGGHDDGPASKAKLAHPNGIAAGPLGKKLYINTLVGEWAVGAKTNMSIRQVDLVSLEDILKEKMKSGSMEEVEATYKKYKNDPARKSEDTASEVSRFAWGLMSSGKFQESLKIFQLNAESYPERWRSHYNLGEVYKIFGQKEPAIAAYEQALKLSPGNAAVLGKLKELRGE